MKPKARILTPLEEFKLENYERLQKQLQTACRVIEKIAYEIHCADCNNWHLDAKRVQELNEERYSVNRREDQDRCSFSIRQIHKLMNDVIEPFLGKSTNLSCCKVKVTPELLEAMGLTKEMHNNRWKPDGWEHEMTLNDFCAAVYMLLSEFRVGHKYPGADMSVYAEGFNNLAYIALDTAHIPHTQEAILKWLDAYMRKRYKVRCRKHK